ncbi:MAG: LysM peptidoglycan-binding domain-containing protein [Verrucomicrobiota bacterium]|nr:LysM peptidoglycan-binding domain-containing protein [Verrucomicrobiota bacterium]
MLRSSFTAVVLAALLFLSGCDKIRQATSPDANDENNSNFQKAKEKYGMMDYLGALDYFERSLRQNSELAKAHLEMGLIYEDKLKDHISAIYHFRKYMTLRPESGKKEMVEEFIQNSMQQLMAQDSVMLSSEKAEIMRLKAENNSLFTQMGNLRKQLQSKGSPKETPPPALSPTPVAVAPTKQQPLLPPATKEVATPPAPIPTGVAATSTNAQEQISLLSQPDKSPQTAAPVISKPSLEPFNKPPVSSDLGSNTTYTVKSGDTLASISRKFYHSSNKWQKILDANPSLGEPKNLKPGQNLVIPK